MWGAQGTPSLKQTKVQSHLGAWKVLRSLFFETGSPNAAGAVALQREWLFVIPPVGLLEFCHFLWNWPVLQDKLERELETDELGVSSLVHREAKNDSLRS